MSIVKIDNIGIGVRDLKKALEFYRDKLGLEVPNVSEGANPSFSVRVGDVSFWVFQTRHPEVKGPQRTSNSIDNEAGMDHISFWVEDVDRAYKELLAKGMKFEVPPTNYSPTFRMAGFRDPDGTRLYVINYKR